MHAKKVADAAMERVEMGEALTPALVQHPCNQPAKGHGGEGIVRRRCHKEERVVREAEAIPKGDERLDSAHQANGGVRKESMDD